MDAEGRPLFRVELPEGFGLQAASAESVWGTTTDALDVPYVVRYRLTEPGSGD